MNFNVGDKVVTTQPLGYDPSDMDYVPAGTSGKIMTPLPGTQDDMLWPYLVSFDDDGYVDWFVSEHEIRLA